MTDNDIINLYFNRDEQAIKATDDKYGNYCHTIATNILEDTEDAKECVNDTFLKIWNLIPPNRPNMLRTFLGKLTRTTAIDLYKKKHANKRGSGQLLLVLDELAECVNNSSEPFEELNRKELVSAINSFLRSISKDKCAIFIRRYWYGDSISSIASRYKLSENNVSVKLNRLRKELRNYILERGFDI